MIIKSERLKRAILTSLAYTDLQRILDVAVYQSKSGNQIIKETNISHTTAYRKIKWLLQEKLLIVDKVQLTEDGEKSSFFRTVPRSLNVRYKCNSVVIEAEQNIDILKGITQKFFSLDDSDDTIMAGDE